jgi:hypothetical protein
MADRNFPTKAQLEQTKKVNEGIKNRGGNVKVLPGASNPEVARKRNVATAKRIKNVTPVHPQQLGLSVHGKIYSNKAAAKKMAYLRGERMEAPVIKVNSAPTRTTAGVTPTTRSVAKLFRPSKGGGIGGIMGNKQR